MNNTYNKLRELEACESNLERVLDGRAEVVTADVLVAERDALRERCERAENGRDLQRMENEYLHAAIAEAAEAKKYAVPVIPTDPEAQAMVDKMAAEAEDSLSGSRKLESVAALRAERDSARAEVARLRKLFEELSVSSGYYHGTDAGSMPVEPSELMPLLQRGFREHHAEIDTNVRIRAEVARLREALTDIANLEKETTGDDREDLESAIDIARAALAGKGER